MVQAPIFHVNGDDPEACVRVGRLAFAFRQAFHKDVVIDMVCYRRYGHNEGDEPSYTQPQMYERIEGKRTVRNLYVDALMRRGDITIEDAERALEDFKARLEGALDQTRSSAPPRPTSIPAAPPPSAQLAPLETGVDRAVLDRIADRLHRPPEGLNVHPKLARQLETRANLYAGGEVDWSLAEALAFGSLLLEGTDVRLTGQDTRRGTFSQRHAVLVDYHTGDELVPLAQLNGAAPERRGGRFFVYDSSLSEFAALGFEYGYSVVHGDALVAWEAQFGDFINEGQVVVDEFIMAAEDKWGQSSSLVLLLPHGYEGQGPDHSSARMERFLTLGAEANSCLVNLTTAGQYFHLLRSQVRREVRRPLVIFTPKSLLRAKAARTAIDDLTKGHFRAVLDDPATSDTGGGAEVDPISVERVILCSGKVAYEAMASRDAHIKSGEGPVTAVVRVEQLYPWPEDGLATLVVRYEKASEVVWLQEEPENMGAWGFVHSRLHRLLRSDYTLRHVSRIESGSPATGSAAMHQLESKDLLARALEPFD
jgi:2-oxoglutarate dehydrogenase E1 component